MDLEKEIQELKIDLIQWRGKLGRDHMVVRRV